MKARKVAGLATLLATLLAFACHAQGESFHFVALGDTAYNQKVDLPIYERLISAINSDQPAFSVHVGDTWGVMPCTEENHRWIKGWFDKFDHPVVYTPGDNEWTDCRKPAVLEAYTRMITDQATAEDMALLRDVQSLDQAFAGGEIDAAGLETIVAECAAIRGRLRTAHLAAHLETRALLTRHQRRQYATLRGYASGLEHPGH